MLKPFYKHVITENKLWIFEYAPDCILETIAFVKKYILNPFSLFFSVVIMFIKNYCQGANFCSSACFLSYGYLLNQVLNQNRYFNSLIIFIELKICHTKVIFLER